MLEYTRDRVRCLRVLFLLGMSYLDSIYAGVNERSGSTGIDDEVKMKTILK